MEVVTSRKNTVVQRFRTLARDGAARREEGVFLCDGEKLLQEALRSGCAVETVLWRGRRADRFPAFPAEVVLEEAVYDYASPLQNSPGPLFTVKIPEWKCPGSLENAIVLEGVQDPGNVGTVLRTADAFGVDAVLLLEGCADVFHPKTVRASMGAVFRQRVLTLTQGELADFCHTRGLSLYGAALSERAVDLRTVSLRHAAVAIGNEGKGLTGELLRTCDGEVILPMSGRAESLNASVAAGIVMWEMQNGKEQSHER